MHTHQVTLQPQVRFFTDGLKVIRKLGDSCAGQTGVRLTEPAVVAVVEP
jgi:hypothetical protein